MGTREERLKKSLVDFVKGGKGLAGTHSATDTYKKWPEYNKMMGGAFAGHPWHKKVPIRILVGSHPLTKAFAGTEFEVIDEIYQFRNDTALPGERKMLLALDNEKLPDIGKGRREDKDLHSRILQLLDDGRSYNFIERTISCSRHTISKVSKRRKAALEEEVL